MLALLKNLTPVYNAVTSMLQTTKCDGKLHGANNIVTMLPISVDVDNITEVGININSDIVICALGFDRHTEYSLSYNKYLRHDHVDHIFCY